MEMADRLGNDFWNLGTTNSRVPNFCMSDFSKVSSSWLYVLALPDEVQRSVDL